VAATPSLPQIPVVSLAQIANTQNTSAVTVFTGGTNGSKVVALLGTSTDSVSWNVEVAWVRTSNVQILTTVTVPGNSGFANAVPSVNLWGYIVGLPLDSDGNPFMFLANTGDTITVQSQGTGNVTNGKVMTFTAIGANF